jgi:hypothetical protein
MSRYLECRSNAARTLRVLAARSRYAFSLRILGRAILRTYYIELERRSEKFPAICVEADGTSARLSDACVSCVELKRGSGFFPSGFLGIAVLIEKFLT